MEPASHELDRLTAIDAQFLTNEHENAHMHIGAVMIFEGDPPTYDELKAHIASRLDFVLVAVKRSCPDVGGFDFQTLVDRAKAKTILRADVHARRRFA